MLNVVIIGGQVQNINKLATIISAIADNVNITARLNGINKSIEYLSQSPAVDIIFSDVTLSDGLSFEIFNRTNVSAPVIFIADHDNFMSDAFEHNCIAYLLNPVDPERLCKALEKYRMFKMHFNYDNGLNRLGHYVNPQKKKRMLLRKGSECTPVLLNDIALFHTKEKSIFAIDRFGNQYLTDKKLSELEHELDDDQFFRVNRQYIININFIRAYKSFEKVKLKINLSIHLPEHSILISQEMAPQFRTWIYNA